jgi:YD repeat-containing protein
MDITYGPGGYLPEIPGGNVVETVVDHGDGTGTRTTYDEHGQVTATEELTGLPIPEPIPAEITLADVAAALRDPLAGLTPSSASTTVRTAILNQRAALDALLAALETP